MTNVYQKSLELIDELFKSTSNEEFLEKYLLAESFEGPLVKDLLVSGTFLKDNYTIVEDSPNGDSYSFYDICGKTSEEFDMRMFLSEITISSKNVDSVFYDSSYATNDDYYSMAA